MPKIVGSCSKSNALLNRVVANIVEALHFVRLFVYKHNILLILSSLCTENKRVRTRIIALRCYILLYRRNSEKMIRKAPSLIFLHKMERLPARQLLRHRGLHSLSPSSQSRNLAIRQDAVAVRYFTRASTKNDHTKGLLGRVGYHLPDIQQHDVMRSSSRVVWTAVFINGANFVAKAVAWLYTGSHSMFAESIHSLADMANQLILAVGIRKSLQEPTADHPYGYHPMRYIAPLISGVGIFCVGCGLSIYHGFEALISSEAELFMSPVWAYGILSFSLLTEGTTLTMAIRALRFGAKKSNVTIREYIARNSDPGLIVVLLEDVAAVLGIGIAASCMALSSLFNTHVFDACGSLLIGSLLGFVASFIIKKNTIALVGKSIPRDTLNNINRIIEKDILIRAIHDVKATDLGNGVVRYKAEVDVDGRELTRKYLEKIDLKELLLDIRKIKNEKDAEKFVLIHGERVVDLLGAEVDRIEKELRRNHPRVKHVDLEVL